MNSAAQNVKDMFASTVSKAKDMEKIDDNFTLDTVEKVQEVVVEQTDEAQTTARTSTANAAATGGGKKVLGWKDRLAALRK